MSSDPAWYFAQNGTSVGPMTLAELVRRLPSAGGLHALIYGPGMANWIEARHVQSVVDAMQGGGSVPPPPTNRRSDEIDYEIFGEEMQYVEVTLDPGETIVAEAGGMMYMTTGIQMETVFGDPSAEKQGFFGKLMTAGKRVLTGESLFMTTFKAAGPAKSRVRVAVPRQDTPDGPGPTRRRTHLSEGFVPLRRARRANRYRLSKENRRRPVRR